MQRKDALRNLEVSGSFKSVGFSKGSIERDLSTPLENRKIYHKNPAHQFYSSSEQLGGGKNCRIWLQSKDDL